MDDMDLEEASPASRLPPPASRLPLTSLLRSPASCLNKKDTPAWMGRRRVCRSDSCMPLETWRNRYVGHCETFWLIRKARYRPFIAAKDAPFGT